MTSRKRYDRGGVKFFKGARMPAVIFAIAAGGAIGSVLRHFVGLAALRLLGAGFPYGTLFVNVVGSFIMGVCIAGFGSVPLFSSQEARAFLTVGLLGGFTTFSAFSLDAVLLYERGEVYGAVLYVALSLALSLTGIVLGLFLTRSFYS